MSKDGIVQYRRLANTNSQPSSEHKLLAIEGDNDVQPTVSESKKFGVVKSHTQNDPLVSDIKWTLFVSACFSHLYETCLDPFPPQFTAGDSKSIDRLTECIDKTPALSLLTEVNAVDLSPVSTDLLHWLFTRLDEIRMKHVPNGNISDLIRGGQMHGKMQEPNHIFQVINKSHSPREHKWQSCVRGRKTFFAFHGNTLDAFHCILYRGFRHFMDITRSGMVVINSLQHSLERSPAGYGVGGSLIGPRLHCVALCEVIDHPDVRLTSPNGPLKVYNVINGDLACVRYLLVYKAPPPRNVDDVPPANEVVFRLKFAILVLVYVLVVSYIWLAH